MTRTEAFDKAWRIAFKEKDFSLVDEIYHPEYSAYDDRTGIDVNLEADKTVVLTLKETITFGPPQTVSENEEILEVQRFVKYKGYRDICLSYFKDHLQRRKNNYSEHQTRSA